MKIAFVAPFGLRKKTTVWARILPLARQLARGGDEVHILIPPWDSPEDAGQSWLDDGVKIQHVRLVGRLPGTTFSLLNALRVIQPDLVHIVKPRAYAGIVQWVLWQMRRFTGRGPILYLDIDDWEQAWNKLSKLNPLLERFLVWQEEWGIRHTDGITAASRWLVDRATNYTPQTSVLYLPNGVEPLVDRSTNLPLEKSRINTQTFSSYLQPTDPRPTDPGPTGPGPTDLTSYSVQRILYFTRFVEIEAEWLACFWKTIHEALPKAQLVVAGDALQPGKKALFQDQVETWLTIECPSASRSIQWLGFVDQETIERLYDTSDCAIFPAKALPLQQAKCSVRLAMTLLNGVPVVASAVGQQSEYGRNGAAHLIDPQSAPEEFAQAVQMIVTHPTDRETLRHQAQSHLLNEFNWAKLGASLREFYSTR